MRRNWSFVLLLLLSLWFVIIPAARVLATEREENGSMEQTRREFGSLNPKAPAELSRFAFLIGRYRCEGALKLPNGESQTVHATWVGRYVLDGYAIQDDYRMTGPTGEVMVLGTNLRAYDATEKTWNMKWLNALSGKWTDLGPEELGGVRYDGPSIIYVLREPVGSHKYLRATYTKVSDEHFTWRGEKSDDRKLWSEVLVLEAYREK